MSEHRIGLTLADSTSPPVPRPYDPDAPNVLVIEAGALPPFDLDAEMAHAMRHQ